MAFNWKSLIPLLETAGNAAELIVPGGAAFEPLTLALENAVNPALLAVGNGNSATNEIMAGYGGLIGVLTVLKSNTKLAPADLTKVEDQLIAAGNALSEYMTGLTGYDASAYTPLTPIV